MSRSAKLCGDEQFFSTQSYRRMDFSAAIISFRFLTFAPSSSWHGVQSEFIMATQADESVNKLVNMINRTVLYARENERIVIWKGTED